MKLLLILGIVFLSLFSFSQIGINCNSSELIVSSNSCNYSDHTTSSTEYWLEFIATSPSVNISLMTTKYGLDAPHIHSLNLFEGNCGSLSLVADDKLPFVNDADELSVDLNASDLNIGQTYFIRADREASFHICTKTNCTQNGSASPTTFSICIEDINVVIPPDFGGEKPNSSLALETNRGQLINSEGMPIPEIKLFNKNSNPEVYIAENFTSYVFVDADEDSILTQRVDMSFSGSNTGNRVFKTENTAGVRNYYLKHIPEGVVGNKSYNRAVITNLYNNIDFQYYSNRRGRKNYFIVNPEGDPNDIVMEFEGANSVNVGNNGELIITSALGELIFEMPHCYQINPGGQVVPMPWQGNYILIGTNKVKFDLKNYPHNFPLFIQMDQGHELDAPKSIENLDWCTYYGGIGRDEIRDIATDQEVGDVYFSGTTTYLDFPATTTTINAIPVLFQLVIAGSHKPLGEPKWSTIYGTRGDVGNSIAVDKIGNAYVTGYSFIGQPDFINFPQPGAYNQSNPSSEAYDQIIILKFNQLNGIRTWATLLGEESAVPSQNVEFFGDHIAVNNINEVYIVGHGVRRNLPMFSLNGGHTQTNTGIPTGCIFKFNTDNDLVWSTMFGNEGTQIHDVKPDFDGGIYICGETTNDNINLYPYSIFSSDDYQASYAGGAQDGFLAFFDYQNNLKWSTTFGGAGTDKAYGISFSEESGKVYVVGETTSNDYPLVDPNDPLVHYQDVLATNSTGFLTCFNYPVGLNGYAPTYSTYFSGSTGSSCREIEIAKFGAVYVAGITSDLNLPLQNLIGGYNQADLGNSSGGLDFEDGFLFAINNESNHFEWSTYFGGDRVVSVPITFTEDRPTGLAVFKNEHLFLGGGTPSDVDFPITVDLVESPNAFIQYNRAGDLDGFLAQFSLTNTLLSVDELNIGNEENAFSIFPNPSNGLFSLIGDNINGEVIIEVRNVLGQLVYSDVNNANGGKFVYNVNLKGQSTGMYLVTLYEGDKKYTKRVVLKK